MSTKAASRFRRNTAVILAGNIIYAACQWGILVAIAKLGSPTDVGELALALAITTPLFAFANLQLRALLATGHAEPDTTFGHFLFVRLAMTLAALVACILYSRFMKEPGPEVGTISFIAFAKASESISDLLHGQLQRDEHMTPIATSQIIRGLLGFALASCAFSIWGNSVAAATGLACASITTASLDLFRAKKRYGWRALLPTYSRAQAIAICRLAIPLGAAMLLASLTSNVPRMLIEHYHGVISLGLFAGAANLIVAGTLVITALGQAGAPRLSSEFRSGNISGFRSTLHKMLLVSISIGVAGTILSSLASDMFLELLYSSEFRAASPVLVVLSIAAIPQFAAATLGQALTAARLIDIQVPMLLLALSTTAIASYTLLPRFGLVGGAWALVVAGVVQAIFAATILRRSLLQAGRAEFAT